MRITINAPDAIAKKIEENAKSQGISVSAYFVQAAEAKLRQEAFEHMNKLIGTTVKDSFDASLEELRQDKASR